MYKLEVKKRMILCSLTKIMVTSVWIGSSIKPNELCYNFYKLEIIKDNMKWREGQPKIDTLWFAKKHT